VPRQRAECCLRHWKRQGQPKLFSSSISLSFLPFLPFLLSSGFLARLLTMLTTAFEYAPSCADIPVTTTSIVSEFYWAEAITTLQVTVPNHRDDRFSSCQPPEWNGAFTFSPAVCPSDWTAYRLSTTLSSVSKAYCCDRYVFLYFSLFDYLFSF
jgi:hypothetical protein